MFKALALSAATLLSLAAFPATTHAGPGQSTEATQPARTFAQGFTRISWATTLDHLFNGQGGGMWGMVVCPPGSARGAPIWGSGVYTSDSPICVAAVHAGLITPSAGGNVVITIAPGQPSYASSTRNGVTSYGYGSWHRSYTLH
ncbi:LCCL domain-containing protein [Gymnodinialimonas sp.]